MAAVAVGYCVADTVPPWEYREDLFRIGLEAGEEPRQHFPDGCAEDGIGNGGAPLPPCAEDLDCRGGAEVPGDAGCWGGGEEADPMACWYWGPQWAAANEWCDWGNWCGEQWQPCRDGERWADHIGDVAAYAGGVGGWDAYDGQLGVVAGQAEHQHRPPWPAGGGEGADHSLEFRSNGRAKPFGKGTRAGRSHIYVPRRLNLAERFTERGTQEVTTTLMIRNVPNQYHRGMLMQELDTLGFKGKYDFVYLPIDNSTLWNVGYAFVNFEDPRHAAACMKAMEGYEFVRFQPGKKRVAQISVAHIQGLEQNLAHCVGTSVFSTHVPWLRPWVRRRSRPVNMLSARRHGMLSPDDDFGDAGDFMDEGLNMEASSGHAQAAVCGLADGGGCLQAGGLGPGHCAASQLWPTAEVLPGYGLPGGCGAEWDWMGSPMQSTRVPSFPSIPSSPPSITAPDQCGSEGGEWLPPTIHEVGRGRSRAHDSEGDGLARERFGVSRTPSPSLEPQPRPGSGAQAAWEAASPASLAPRGTPPTRGRSPRTGRRSSSPPAMVPLPPMVQSDTLQAYYGAGGVDDDAWYGSDGDCGIPPMAQEVSAWLAGIGQDSGSPPTRSPRGTGGPSWSWADEAREWGPHDYCR